MVSIPLEQGGVFRLIILALLHYAKCVSIPLEQGGVFRLEVGALFLPEELFQSLWNRAGSFDRNDVSLHDADYVSIPLEQGGVFRRTL